MLIKRYICYLLYSGIKWTLKILEETDAFKALGTQLSPTVYPACRRLQFRSDDYWRCFIREEGTSWFHMVGTCTMGLDSDPMAVTDSKMRFVF
jgi:choline dehydrogenase-like flavoprotein